MRYNIDGEILNEGKVGDWMDHVYKFYSDFVYDFALKLSKNDEVSESIRTKKEIDDAYKYTDRFLPAAYRVAFKRLFQMQKNLFMHPLSYKSYDILEKDLLDLVNKSKDIKELEYLQRDMYAGKAQLKRMAQVANKKGQGDKVKDIEKHIEWLGTTYSSAISAKKKALKKGIKESVEYKIPDFI